MDETQSKKPVIADPESTPTAATPIIQSKIDQNANIFGGLVIVDWHDWREGISHKESWLLQARAVPWSGLIFLLLAMVFLGSQPLAAALGTSRMAVLCVLAVPLILALIVCFNRSRVATLSPSEKVLHGEPGSRVRWIASEPILQRVGMPSLDPFEPRFFRVFGAVRGEKWLRRSIAVGCALCTLGAFAFLRGAGQLSWAAFGAGGMPLFFDVQVAIFMAYVPTFVLWPTYYRVVPGRLDIMKYAMLGAGRPEVQRVDLRDCRVSADACSGAIRIERAGGERTYLQFQGVPASRMEFAKAVAEAAISPHPAPPLPDDELLG